MVYSRRSWVHLAQVGPDESCRCPQCIAVLQHPSLESKTYQDGVSHAHTCSSVVSWTSSNPPGMQKRKRGSLVSFSLLAAVAKISTKKWK